MFTFFGEINPMHSAHCHWDVDISNYSCLHIYILQKTLTL